MKRGGSSLGRSDEGGQTGYTAFTGYADLLAHGAIGQGLNDCDRIFSTFQGAGFADGFPSKEALSLGADDDDAVRPARAIHGGRGSFQDRDGGHVVRIDPRKRAARVGLDGGAIDHVERVVAPVNR